MGSSPTCRLPPLCVPRSLHLIPTDRRPCLLKVPSAIQYTFAIRQPRLGRHARGLVQSVFSPPPRLATSRLDLNMIRRVAGLKTLCIMHCSALPPDGSDQSL